MPGEFCQVHSKRDMRILKGSFKGVKVSLGMSDPMEEVNKFMGNRVFTEEGNLFNDMEDDRGFKDGSVEQVNSMYFYSMDRPLSFSSIRDPPACSSLQPLPRMQPSNGLLEAMA